MTRDDVIRSTAAHIRRVGELLADESHDLNKRAVRHDASKWSPEEWPAFEATTPKLAGLTYGSDEYRASLREIKPAIEHHQGNNSHHPEFYSRSCVGMTLLDLVEMLCDWKAATERHNDGSIFKSLQHNRARFSIPDGLFDVMVNTAFERAWITWEEAVQLVPALASLHRGQLHDAQIENGNGGDRRIRN